MAEANLGMIEALRRALSTHMLAQGWKAIDLDSPGTADVGTFFRPIANEFVVIVLFPWCPFEQEDSVAVAARLGLDYIPSRRLLGLLIYSSVAGALLRNPAEVITFSSGSDVGSAADRLAQFVSCEAPSTGDVDRLIDALRDGQAVPLMGSMMRVYAGELIELGPGEPVHPEGDAELVPALLAGAGRHEEARRALARSAACQPKYRQLGRRRFFRQLGRVLEADGQLQFPTTPPRWPPHTPRQARSRHLALQQATKAERDALAEREAVDAVRAAQGDESREQLRARLEAELATRGLAIAPLRVVGVVEELSAERPRRSAKMHRLFGAAGRLSSAVFSVATSLARGTEMEPKELPEWVEPPDRAGFPVWAVSGEWAEVELVPGASEWLKTVWHAVSLPGLAVRDVNVWLTSPSETPDGDSALKVHLGSQCVGTVASATAAHFRPAFDAALERDEDPWARARLSSISRSQQLLLELAIPPTAPPSAVSTACGSV